MNRGAVDRGAAGDLGSAVVRRLVSGRNRLILMDATAAALADLAQSRPGFDAVVAEARLRGLSIAVAGMDARSHSRRLRPTEAARPIAAAMAQAKARTGMMTPRDRATPQDAAIPGAPAFRFQHQLSGAGNTLPGGVPANSGCAEAAARLCELLEGKNRGQD